MLPRQERRLQSVLADFAHPGLGSTAKAGETVAGEEAFTDAAAELGEVAGGNAKAAPKTKSAPNAAAMAYRAGKALPGWEVRLSSQHAPRDKDGAPLCWGNSCHIGCTRGNGSCAHSHELVKQ